jgi:hypothetical protein
MQVPPGRFTNFSTAAVIPELQYAELVLLSPTQALVMFAPWLGQEMRGPGNIAQICFNLLSPQGSAFVPVELVDIVGLRSDGTPVGNTDGRSGRVAVVGGEPLLEAVHDTNGTPRLIVYGKPGTTNVVEFKTVLDANGPWQTAFEMRIPSTNLFQTIPISLNQGTIFYRARKK